MKFQEIEDEAQRLELRRVLSEGVELARTEANEHADRGVRYLTLVNGGSSVALMAFMGASETVRSSSASWTALSLFCAGIGLVGAGMACAYVLYTQYHTNWRRQTDLYFSNELDFEQLQARINGQGKFGTRWGYVRAASIIFAYASWFCWIAGAIVVAAKLVPRPEGPWV